MRDENLIDEYVKKSLASIERCLDCTNQLILVAKLLENTLNSGKKILFCGNGGSAAQSQHLAAEFSGRFLLERPALSSISLTTDTSAITAIANDYGYNMIFKRQLAAIDNDHNITSNPLPYRHRKTHHCESYGRDCASR